MKYKKGYQIREKACKKRDCFLPFSGNGIKICRLYEMGQCPKKYLSINSDTQNKE